MQGCEIKQKIKPYIPIGLYGITCQSFSNGKSNIECVEKMIKGGIKIIQYREKHAPFENKLKEAKIIAKLCRQNNVVFIVNDHIDIALAVKADGVHLGQDDFNIDFVRSIVSNQMIIGKSTHSPEQAKRAVLEGYDYIGIGPIFKTTTKDRNPVGLEYLDYAVKNINIPFIAIGGIKESNLEKILSHGARRVALVSEIVGADDITKKTQTINFKIIMR